jgi:sulfur-carrier protein
MKIRIKLYGTLAGYLPAESTKNESELEVPAGATPRRVMMRLGLPETDCERVVVNGAYVDADARDRHVLEDGDQVAVWPADAG